MWWMWIVGPVLVAIIYLVTAGRDRRTEAEVERWRTKFWPRAKDADPEDVDRGYREVPAKSAKRAQSTRPGAKTVMSLPGPLHRMVQAAGGGDPVARIELVPKFAYLVSMGANAVNGSDHCTVVGRLEDAAPSFSSRPLPLVEGERVANTGVEFKKDPEFMALYLTEVRTGADATVPGVVPPSPDISKKIRGWLSRPIRDALRDLPEAWLIVHEKAFSLSVYGPMDAEKINQLVTVADVIFAEYGADGGASLFGDDDEDDEDEADDDREDEADDREDDEADAKAKAKAKAAPPASAAKKAKPAAKAPAKAAPAKR